MWISNSESRGIHANIGSKDVEEIGKESFGYTKDMKLDYHGNHIAKGQWPY